MINIIYCIAYITLLFASFEKGFQANTKTSKDKFSDQLGFKKEQEFGKVSDQLGFKNQELGKQAVSWDLKIKS